MSNVIKFNRRQEDKISNDNKEQYVWRCNCGCSLFYISPDYIYCADCELIQDDF